MGRVEWEGRVGGEERGEEGRDGRGGEGYSCAASLCVRSLC